MDCVNETHPKMEYKNLTEEHKNNEIFISLMQKLCVKDKLLNIELTKVEPPAYQSVYRLFFPFSIDNQT